MDIRWSPNHEDKFYTFSYDLPRLALYKVSEVTDDVSGQRDKKNRLSDGSYATPLSFNSDIPYKCVAWCPCQYPDHLIAVGHINGRVQLTSFGKGGTPDNHNLLGKELVPRHSRPCIFLEWNPTETHLLAEVLERSRQDYSILVWDVKSGVSYELPHSSERKTSGAAMESSYSSRPVIELCQSDIVSSLAWFVSEPLTLVAGVGNKYLKIFDTRDNVRPVSTSITKAVSGVTIDRNCEHRLASFHENQIAIWDRRSFEKPVSTLQESKAVVRLSWSPVRTGLLGCLVRDSSIVKFYELHQPSIGDEVDLCFTDKVLKPMLQIDGSSTVAADVKLTSFDWHPTRENRLIVIGNNGALADVFLAERAAICWSPDIYLTWTNGQQMNHFHSIKMCKESSEDIGPRMRRRALKGYGISENLNMVKKHLSGCGKLRRLWDWIKMIKKLQNGGVGGTGAEATIGSGCFTYQDGVSTVLRSVNVPSEAVSRQWHGVPGVTMRIYLSHERTRVLALCGWSFEKETSFTSMINKLVQAGEVERAAAIAVFTLKVWKAIEILQGPSFVSNQPALQQEVEVNSASSDLVMTAMALSGFIGSVNESKSTLWLEQCRKLCARLSNPYLRAMFSFLTAPDPDSFDSLLSEPLELVDQVAFACIYLPDSKLLDFVSKKTVKCIEEGDLGAVILTGMSREGIDMMQNYVDGTGDVQTAAIVAVHCVPEPEYSRDPRINIWVVAYQDLLDTWRLWNQRAEFDVFRCRMNRSSPPRPQIVVMCNFCAKSIGYDGLSNLTLNRFMGGCETTAAVGASPAPLSTKPRVSSCSQCRKPLPRCSVCLMRLGTPVGSILPSKPKSSLAGQKNIKVSEWMTWCQSCRHGGHASHLMEWFKDHKECPVSDCKCCCLLLDSATANTVDLDALLPLPDKQSDLVTSKDG